MFRRIFAIVQMCVKFIFNYKLTFNSNRNQMKQQQLQQMDNWTMVEPNNDCI